VPGTDPFAVIETETPRLVDDEVLQIIREHYGLVARLEPLLSERDQNFRLQCDDGRELVLKIANSAEDPLATDFQVQALLHLETWMAAHDCPVTVPRIVRTVDGQPSISITSAGNEHVVRIVTYLDGRPLGVNPASPLLCRHLGACLAHLGRALSGFEHPGSGHGLLWDMQQALELRKILEHVPDPQLRQGITQTLDDFETHALPRFGGLRSQVIHSDLNPDNVLVDEHDPDRVAGVIDFGDMLKAPLVVDVAVGASYLRAMEGNPLSGIAEFLSAYHSVTPLDIAEIDILFDLIKTRLAASITILFWRATLRGADDAYLAGAVRSEGNAADYLNILLQMPRESAQQTFRQICASASPEVTNSRD
jgi:Ser/Thr protein kinase RdoA (MazF antagonist)